MNTSSSTDCVEDSLCSRSPYGRFLRPGTVKISLAELSCGITKRGCIVGRLVTRYACPVQRFSGRIGVGTRLHQLIELALSFVETARRERHVAETQHQLCEEIVSRKEPFNAMSFLTGRIKQKNRRGPLCTVSLPETLELLLLLADMHTYRYEVLLDQARHSFIRIHLGIQPSTTGSQWSRAEIEQCVPLLSLRVRQSLFDVTSPGNRDLMFSHDTS